MEQVKNPMKEGGPQPLAGVKVVDLSRLVSGNMLTHDLADLGATVVKIEPPRKGDDGEWCKVRTRSLTEEVGNRGAPGCCQGPTPAVWATGYPTLYRLYGRAKPCLRTTTF